MIITRILIIFIGRVGRGLDGEGSNLEDIILICKYLYWLLQASGDDQDLVVDLPQ